MKTLEELWSEQYPKQYRFVVGFEHIALLDNGTLGYYPVRRFCMAVNANDAREFLRLGELADKSIWDGHFHKWQNIVVNSASHFEAYPGYFRFAAKTLNYERLTNVTETEKAALVN